MFDFVSRNKTLVQVVLGTVTLGLTVTAGVGGYSLLQNDQYLAKVNGEQITDYDVSYFAHRLQQQVNVDDPQVKSAIVQQLAQERVLKTAATDLHLVALRENFLNMLAQVPAFQVNGKFDQKRYLDVLASNEETPETFWKQYQKDALERDLLAGVIGNAIIPAPLLDLENRMVKEKREIEVSMIKLDGYQQAADVAPSAAEIKKYYEAHKADFKLPERVRLEYIQLDQAAMAANQTVSDAEAQQLFEKTKSGRPADQTFDQVKPKLLEQLKIQKGSAQFRSQKEQLSKLVFDQGTSLKPASAALKLPVQTTGWISRNGSEGTADKRFDQKDFLTQIFKDDILRARQNTDVITLADGVAVAARVAEYSPEQIPALDKVSAQITDTLKHQKMIKKAEADGTAKLKLLQEKKDAGLTWEAPQQISRGDLMADADEVAKGIFRVDAAKLPAYVGGATSEGYLIVKVNKILPPEPLDQKGRDALQQALQMVAQDTLGRAYLNTLLKQVKVTYRLPVAKQ